MASPTREVFSELLQKAVHEPGIISQAYRQFHQYSIGNQILAGNPIPERSAQRILKTADQILKAGTSEVRS